MSMSKKNFIALADAIRDHNNCGATKDGIFDKFTENQLFALADFCLDQNYQFNRSRWLSYIAGECGPNGGSVKTRK